MPSNVKKKAAREASWASSEAVRRSMQSNRPRDTKPELRLRRAAHALGLRFRVSARPLPNVRRTADLLFTRVKIAVFVDGCYWHGCPEHHTVAKTNAEFWADKVETNRRRDRETNALLEENGWLVIRVWEHEPIGDVALTIRDEWCRRDATLRSGARL
jgi:DNA mismatch endonuclease, patch repair protein